MSTDVYSPEKRSAVMRQVKGRDTAPELAVRRLLARSGIGYRLGGCGLPGRPDVVMQGRRIALFVHGYFWHGHDCARGDRPPKTNAGYWLAKIGRNRERDAQTRQALEADGWTVVTVWECEMRKPGFDDALVSGLRRYAAPVSGAATSSASARTWDSAPSRAGGVRGLDTK